jgi:hypothetical protein
MCTVLLPPGVNPIAVKCIIYHIISYHIISYNIYALTHGLILDLTSECSVQIQCGQYYGQPRSLNGGVRSTVRDQRKE